MAHQNAFDESHPGQCRSNVLPLCAPSARLALDDIPLYGDLNEFLGFPEEEGVVGEGTYISKWLDDRSAERLATWLTDNGVPNPVDEFHITLFEQRATIPWAGVQNWRHRAIRRDLSGEVRKARQACAELVASAVYNFGRDAKLSKSP
jgi:hypothetical protein